MGRGFDPPVRQHYFVEMGHEIISTAILSLPLIQVGQLSVTSKRICTLPLRPKPTQESVVRLTDCLDMTLVVHWDVK